jgi:hypothetical protein
MWAGVEKPTQRVGHPALGQKKGKSKTMSTAGIGTNRIIATALACCLFLPVVAAGLGCSQTPNAYDLLNRHYTTVVYNDSGLAIGSTYREGVVEISGEAVATFREWAMGSSYNRKEVVYADYCTIGGRNGTYDWDAEPGLGVTIDSSLSSQAEIRIDKECAQGLHVDTSSSEFSVQYLGTSYVGGDACYAIRISSNTVDVAWTTYIDTLDYLELRRDEMWFGDSARIDFSDYREVGGYILSYEQSFSWPSQELDFRMLTDRYAVNVAVPDFIFEPSIDTVVGYRFEQESQ